VKATHGLDDRPGECTLDGGGAEQDRRCRLVSGLGQPYGRRRADEPDLAAGLFFAGAIRDHGVAQLIGDRDTGGTGAEGDHRLILHRDAGDAGAGVHGGQHDRPGSLHVAEDPVAAAVGVQDLPRIFRVDGLEVQQRAGEQPRHRLHVARDEGVVILAATPGTPTAQVERIAAQCLVVGAGIERHGDHPAGADTGGSGVDRQLPRRYLDAADAPVTDAGDLLAIAAHDDVNVAGAQAEGGKGLLDVAGPVDRQVDPVRAAVLRRGLPDPIATAEAPAAAGASCLRWLGRPGPPSHAG
jgi:hypothetical protein